MNDDLTLTNKFPAFDKGPTKNNKENLVSLDSPTILNSTSANVNTQDNINDLKGLLEILVAEKVNNAMLNTASGCKRKRKETNLQEQATISKAPKRPSANASRVNTSSTNLLAHACNDDSASSSEDEQNETISIPDTDMMDKQIADLLSDNTKKGNDEDSLDSDNEAYLSELKVLFAEKEQVSDSVEPALADIINNTWKKPPVDDNLKDKLVNVLRPKNCDTLVVKKCNPEIWSQQLRSNHRSKDLKLQKVQMYNIKGASAAINCTSQLLKLRKDKHIPKNAKEALKPIIESCLDVITFLGKSNGDIDKIRREEIKYQLSSDLRGLAHNVPDNSELLFGDDISKRITLLKDSNRNFKSKDSNSGNKSFNKYNHHQSKNYRSFPKNPGKRYNSGYKKEWKPTNTQRINKKM